MKTFGRILLLISGLILIGTSIPLIIYTFKQINELGWSDFTTIPTKAELLAKLILQGIYIPFGIAAIISGIRGKLSFKLVVYALVIIACIVFYIVIAIKAGKLWIPENIWQTIAGTVTTIGYILGTIFVGIGQR